LFEHIVKQCIEAELVRDKDQSVNGSFAEANAAKESRCLQLFPRESLILVCGLLCASLVFPQVRDV
jgi:hypothetical protein